MTKHRENPMVSGQLCEYIYFVFRGIVCDAVRTLYQDVILTPSDVYQNQYMQLGGLGKT